MIYQSKHKGFFLLFLALIFSLLTYFALGGHPKNIFKNHLSSKTICIDPGHHVKAEGTVGISSGTPEYQIALLISLKLKGLLEKKGYKVVMTREKNQVNISNEERTEIANRAKAEIFVRIHADGSNDPSVNGISVLYPANNRWTKRIHLESKRAARIILNELVITTGAKKRGIFSRGDLIGFNRSNVPVILIEVGYLTNPQEDELLNKEEYQWKVAQGICNGVSRFANRKWYQKAKDRLLTLFLLIDLE